MGAIPDGSTVAVEVQANDPWNTPRQGSEWFLTESIRLRSQTSRDPYDKSSVPPPPQGVFHAEGVQKLRGLADCFGAVLSRNANKEALHSEGDSARDDEPDEVDSKLDDVSDNMPAHPANNAMTKDHTFG